MRTIGRIAFSIISNAVAFLATDYLLAGFVFEGTFLDLLGVAFIFTLIHVFVRPVLKLLLGPLIVLTFGLFIIVINALTLYFLDIVSTALTIQGYLPLLIATLIIGIVNTTIHLSAKIAHR
ncbi:MAG TPA: hypothetical protein ENH86_01900 [Candidatus Jorgensenbacteria bacterium]|uniref:Phage holin family protein n=1 Tax=marine sediment metagenome TaxID=412755 RepID=A0A0F9LCP3_9ZZZZ|nr:hypothetical protein [Candidatus Jorgensenbacteria bacterium]